MDFPLFKIPAKLVILCFIVKQLQNTNASAEPCRIIDTVCDSPPVSLLNLIDYKNGNKTRSGCLNNENSVAIALRLLNPLQNL